MGPVGSNYGIYNVPAGQQPTPETIGAPFVAKPMSGDFGFEPKYQSPPPPPPYPPPTDYTEIWGESARSEGLAGVSPADTSGGASQSSIPAPPPPPIGVKNIVFTGSSGAAAPANLVEGQVFASFLDIDNVPDEQVEVPEEFYIGKKVKDGWLQTWCFLCAKPCDLSGRSGGEHLGGGFHTRRAVW